MMMIIINDEKSEQYETYLHSKYSLKLINFSKLLKSELLELLQTVKRKDEK